MALESFPGYDAAGLEHDRAILFVHGLRVTRSLWRPQMQAFADRYRTLAPDLPGHGSRAAAPFTLDAAVEVLRDLVDAQGGAVLLVGTSLGGYVGCEFVHRYPDKVRGFALCDASAIPIGVVTLPYRLAALFFALFKGGALWFDKWLWRTKYPPEVAEPVIAGGFYHRAVGDAVREIAGKDFLAKLVAYTGPVLILNGRRDWFRIHEKRYLRSLPNARLAIVPGAGHIAHLDNPAAFNAHLRGFVESIS